LTVIVPSDEHINTKKNMENILNFGFKQFFPEEKQTLLINVKENKVEIVDINKRKQLIQNSQNYKVIPDDIFVFKNQDDNLTLIRLKDVEAYEVNVDQTKKVGGFSTTPNVNVSIPVASASLNPIH
jgi:Fe-S cluster biosynthesis and repair protein YggX